MGKRVLMASMSVGGGHGRAAQNVAAALHEQAPDWEVRSVDLRDHVARWFRALYASGYLFIIRRMPWLWGFLYRHPPRRGGTLPGWLLRRVGRPFERLVCEFQPDVILATQITASEAADGLRARGVYAGAAGTVVTDFDAHPSWRAEGIDCFFVPDDAIREGFLRLGIPAKRVEATGVPISPAFERGFDVPALKARHGVRPGVPVVLLMGGSLGIGPMETATRALLASGGPLDLLVVAGHNEPLKRRLERLEAPGERRLRAFGFIDYVAELMALADLFVSKPGGLSMTEAVTLGVPTLAIAPLPGQEVANARHLEARGVVRALGPREALAPTVAALLSDRAARERLAAAARAYALRGAAHRIARRLVELAEARGEERG